MKMLGLIMKRPTDKQIKTIKIIFGIALILTGILAFNIQNLQIQDTIFGQVLTSEYKMYLSYAIMSLGVFPLFLGGLDINILSRGRTRILQIVFGILLMFISGLFTETATLSADILYFLLGLGVLIAGITGKVITKKGLKTGQKITKIRV